MNPPVPPEPDPPEPEPDPPEPVTPAYTYSTHSTFPDGSYTSDFYQDIQDSQGNACSVVIRRSGYQSDDSLSCLAITNVTAFDQINYYFSNANKTIVIYADNATVGGTHPYYAYDSEDDTWVQYGMAEVKSSVPVDYFTDIKSGNFTLSQRS